MKIAIISDIHGNLPALHAVLEDIESRGISTIICLGDLIGKGPNSPEAVDICREKCWQMVMGNWDKYLATEDQKDGSFLYYKDQLGSKRLQYLGDLPGYIEFYLSGKLVRLFHAHPLDVYKRVHPTSPLEDRVNMFLEPELPGRGEYTGCSDIVGYGDIHWAYVQTIQNGILFNSGSVGNPLDMTMASYVIMEGEYESKVPGTFSIQFCRVPYDIELAVRQAEAGNVPELDAYITELRTAVYRHR